ncbi:hypothetical protein [Streptomyces sp. NPDC014734]|uniref:hypothetical protein n=1 Tax=Streptomyces sp. NPDC014734 TaxID=3364886 RepID=UPI0036FD77E2
MIEETRSHRPRRSGLTTGILILTVFASLWATLGISVIPGGMAVTAASVVLAAGFIAATIFFSLRSQPAEPDDRDENAATGNYRSFGLINFAQTVAIFVSLVILGRIGQWALVPPVVCLIVGLHFLPLARTFGEPRYRWAGTLMTAVSLAGILVFAADAGAGAVRAVVGFGAALVLWATALRMARHR